MSELAAPFDVRFSATTTSQETLERAAYALAQALSAQISRDDQDWVVTIHPRGDSGEDLAHRFRQEVTDQSLRARIAERTDPVRTLVWALAFSKTGLAQTDPS